VPAVLERLGRERVSVLPGGRLSRSIRIGRLQNSGARISKRTCVSPSSCAVPVLVARNLA
jgi:hypothetical protein